MAEETPETGTPSYGRFSVRNDDPAPRRRLVPVVAGATALALVIGVGWGLIVWWRDAPEIRDGHTVIGAAELGPGDCVMLTEDRVIAGIEVLPCAEEHDAQVYAVFTLGAHDLGTQPAIDLASRTGCMARRAVAKRMVHDGAGVNLRWYTPDITDPASSGAVICLFTVSAAGRAR
ncbi:hypothetical protein F0U44_03655 [Nocardioides humilatus]|uniref:Septum formation-related domain-containing protein n=1 Tax=Nocardioides humilatus TaxID=2607660 RepID=A0A5B1LKX0_9ACTN|nr:hypothetical protein [Nocardioides humilatus]KAA1421405.1 hypothetical protein F0U44_03655 [Nocardioides humilatus]